MNGKNVCIICNTKPAEGGWVYIWEGKSGYACPVCGKWFHEVGDYLLEAARKTLTAQGVLVRDKKEKFGEWRMYVRDNEHGDAKKLERVYGVLFPEFSWSFE